MPIKIAIEKLRGFVADHQAKIVSIDGNRVQLEIVDRPATGLRRLTDRAVCFRMDLCIEEEQVQSDRTAAGQSPGTRTRIRVAVSPRKDRDRRRKDMVSRAKEVLMSFRSYLMATEQDCGLPTDAISRVKRVLAPWLTPR